MHPQRVSPMLRQNVHLHSTVRLCPTEPSETQAKAAGPVPDRQDVHTPQKCYAKALKPTPMEQQPLRNSASASIDELHHNTALGRALPYAYTNVHAAQKMASITCQAKPKILKTPNVSYAVMRTDNKKRHEAN